MTDVSVFAARRATSGEPDLVLGEGPVWDETGERVLWVDVQSGIVFEGGLDGGIVTRTGSLAFGETVGAVIPAADGGLVVAGHRHLRLLDRERAQTGFVRLVPDAVASRLNDAVCDPAGRLLVGTLALDGRTAEERLIGFDASGRITTVVDGLTLSNGIGFSPDGTTMYLVDSIPGVVWAFEYDLDSGRAGDRRLVSGPGNDVPDGLAVDVEGNLWIACFGAGQVRCMRPSGELLAVVHVPAPNTTCPAFVGRARDLLLIATAREQLTADQLERWPESGSLFVADVGVTGLETSAWAGRTVRETGPDEAAAPTEGIPQ